MDGWVGGRVGGWVGGRRDVPIEDATQGGRGGGGEVLCFHPQAVYWGGWVGGWLN